MGDIPFSGMGITKDYASLPHIDSQDCGMSFITWFLSMAHYTSLGLCVGVEFLMQEWHVCAT